MKFKIGDKVRITALEDNKKYVGKIGKIIEVDRIKRGKSIHWDYACDFEEDGLLSYPFEPKEIEKVLIKGEQLLFSFMEQ